jgi:hypothetical protein
VEFAVMTLSPSAIAGLQALALGFAFAGLIASAYELLTERRAGFSLLQGGGFRAVASVPIVLFAAPFLILRNTARGRRIEGRPIHFVVLASMVASVWSLACGQVLIDLVKKVLML